MPPRLWDMYTSDDLRKQLDVVTRERDELRERVKALDTYEIVNELPSNGILLLREPEYHDILKMGHFVPNTGPLPHCYDFALGAAHWEFAELGCLSVDEATQHVCELIQSGVCCVRIDPCVFRNDHNLPKGADYESEKESHLL